MASIAAYASLLRSALAGAGGDVLANAINQIATTVQTMQTQLTQLNSITQGQSGQVSAPQMDITQLNRLYDFYDLPEIQYISSTAAAISPTGTLVRVVNTSGGDLTLASTPTIYAGLSNGEILQVINYGTGSNAHNITVQDKGTLSNSNIALVGGGSLSIPPGFQASFQYFSDLGYWSVLGVAAATAAYSNVINYTGPNGTLSLSGITWSNNTPIAGGIQSSACTATYQGISYAVPSFNTSNSFVYWKLSSPNTFQSSNLPIGTLSADTFIIAFNSGGAYEPAVNLIRSSDGARQILFGDTSFYTNGSGVLMESSGVGGATANDHGVINLYDNTGTARIQMTGDTGNITHSKSGANTVIISPVKATTATAGAGTLPANPVAFLQWSVDGVTAKIPYYAA